MRRLAIITTHPIQYYAPVFRLLAERKKIAVKVFYTWEKEASAFDVDFGRVIEWDIPLLEGYEYEFVSNRGSHRKDFLGVKNPRLVQRVEDWQPDAIMVIGWNFYSHLKAMRHFKNRVPVFFRGDSTLLDETRGLKTMARRLFLKWVYSHVDLAFYVGANNKDYYLKHGLRESQLAFAPHAIDNSRFEDRSGKYLAQALQLRAGMGIGPGETVVLFAGKLQAKKDPQLLLEAFLEAAPPAWRLVFAGNGALENALKARAAKDPRVHFLPFQNQSQMPAVYRLADIFCLPSAGPGETWGLAINEAMACGLPVIVSDKCGCSADLVQPGNNGFIFASGNKPELAQVIKICADQQSRLKEMGEKGRSIIQSWTFAAIAASIESSLNGKGARPEEETDNL